MSKISDKKSDAINRIVDENDTNTDIIKTLPDFMNEKNLLLTIQGRINSTQVLKTLPKDADGNTILTSKSYLGTVLSECLYRGSVSAYQSKQPELADTLDKSYSAIIHGSKDQIIFRAETLKELLNANLTVLTNVTPADITKIDGAITGMIDVKDLPHTIIIERKALITDPLKVCYKDGMDCLHRIIKLVKGNPTLFTTEQTEKYVLKAKVEKPVAIPTPLVMTVRNSVTNEVIENVKAVRTSSKAAKKPTFVSDDNGLISFKTHQAGKFSYQFSLSGFKNQTVKFIVQRHKSNTVEVLLVPIS